MDPKTAPVQNGQGTTQSDQSASQVQQASNLPTAPSQTQQGTPSTPISVDKEGPTAVVAETSAADEVVTSSQEKQTQAVQQSGVEAGNVEIAPATPELSAKPEVEGFAEKSPDQEKPDLSKAVQDAGVTHSGPGVIDVAQNSFGVTKMPSTTFSQAAEEEKKTPFNDSKHWFSAMIMYIWRKIKPKEGEEEK